MGWGNAGGEDIAFVEALHAALLGDVCVDTDLVLSTGFSYGGSTGFSYGGAPRSPWPTTTSTAHATRCSTWPWPAACATP